MNGNLPEQYDYHAMHVKASEDAEIRADEQARQQHVMDEKHKAEVHAAAGRALIDLSIANLSAGLDLNTTTARLIVAAIVAGKIPHVEVKY